MPIAKKTDFVIDRSFDPKSCRHSINGDVQVLHCHHYATLYSQLAIDCGMLDGKKLLMDVAEDSFYKTLTDYYKAHNLTDMDDRIAIAEQYYAVAGLGKMKVKCMGPDSGEVELAHSHVDEGWVKKFGKSETPVNFITAGYVAGLFAAIQDKQPRSFSVKEVQSIVSGADSSLFEVVTN